MQGRANHIIKSLYNGKFSKLKIGIKETLGLGIYQIDHMYSIPNYAAISSTVELIKTRFPGFERIANGMLREYIRKADTFQVKENEEETLSILSHPNWLIQKWIKAYGFKKTVKICQFNNTPQRIWFRKNLNIPNSSLENKIKEMGLIPTHHPMNKFYFKVEKPRKLINSEIFKNGYLSIQNPINGFIVDLIDPKNKDIIIDGCAAPGGKGSLISAIAPNSDIISIDNNQNRLKKLYETIKRQNIKNIKIEVKNMATDSMKAADKILLDVPCTGTGVANRRVNLRWRRSIDDIREMSKIQYAMLDNASKYIKDDGIIIYSTCSIENEENQEIVDKFLKNHNFIVEDAGDFVNNNIIKDGAIKVLPGEHNLDGGFAVRLKKLA
tara:strand:- start:358 stop:1503 length:1146 start_codon:yes stop_codon:yes gene_type:complete